MNTEPRKSDRNEAVVAVDNSVSLSREGASSGRRAAIAIAGVVLFALATAVSAQIGAPLPGTPVPVTLQTLVVLLGAMTLGPWLGSAGMAFYLLLGMCGAPVFADGVWKDGVFFGHTGGYLIGFLLAQPVIGHAARMRWGKVAWSRLLLAGVAGHAVIFATGLAWLSIWLGTDLPRTLELGLWPFMLGAAIKTALAAAAGGGLARTFDRLHCQ
jgi:biotin transport system substrate-specific component